MRVVLCTAPPDVAADLARTLVSERLCACVNVIPGVQSYYWWEGAVQADAEALLVIKTTAERLPALMEGITAHHPYTVPEIVALTPTEVTESYLAWVAREAKPIS